MGFGPRPEDGLSGTRFRLFPQPSFLDSFERAETVWVSSPPGSLGPGPSDDRMYVVDPIGKPSPYGIHPGPRGSTDLYLPPWRGAASSTGLGITISLTSPSPIISPALRRTGSRRAKKSLSASSSAALS